MQSLSPVRTPSRDRKRRVLHVPKLLDEHDENRHCDPRRIKDVREEAQTQMNERFVGSAMEEQQHQRTQQFHARWHHVRVLYAMIEQVMRDRRAASVPVPKQSQNSPVKLAPVASISWLYDVMRVFQRDFVANLVTGAQLEIAMSRALRIEAFTSASGSALGSRFRAVYQSYEHTKSSKVDWRELLCAFLLLDRWREGEKKLLVRWWDVFSAVSDRDATPHAPLSVHKLNDVRLMLCSASEGSDEEKALLPFAQALHRVPGGVTESVLQSYVEDHPELVDALKQQCWRRLTDDMRLTFYRDLYEEAKLKFEQEEFRARVAAAVELWRKREPRQRLARWKEFIFVQRLRRRGDAHFRAYGYRRAIRLLLLHRSKQQQMREWRLRALHKYQCSLLGLALSPWKLFFNSMQLLHQAAWQRSCRHLNRVRAQRTWKQLVLFLERMRARQAEQRRRVEIFVTVRHRKIVQESMVVWQEFYRRRVEVRHAEQRERMLHQDFFELKRMETEVAQMTLEDAISRAVEAKERELEEKARKQAFRDASLKVYANRKLRQQEEERTESKRKRKAEILDEMEAGWASIQAKICVQSRESTIAWFATSEGIAAVNDEATRIFERDLIATQKAVLQDPGGVNLVGCRWQLRLEDYGGRFAKVFYLNTETFEKIVCDELVMENCEEIAKEVIIQQKIDLAKQKMQQKAARVYQDHAEHHAAITIQMLFRCRHALIQSRNVIRTQFIKRIDPSSGDVVFFNIARQETRRKPPRLIGSDVNTIPVESTTWVRRTDDDGNDFYMRLDDPDEPASWTPPDHFIMCMHCHHNFATRRNNDTGLRFCVGCYAEALHQQKKAQAAPGSGPLTTWTKLSVAAATCVVCRNNAAELMCAPCRGDATCSRCWAAVHRSTKLQNQNHAPVSLVAPRTG